MDSSDGARLRVFFITEDDPLYVAQFFETFLEEYPRRELEVIGITVARAFNESLLATGRRVLRFYGPRDFPRLLARFARARIGRRGIASLARREGIPVVPTESVNDATYVAALRRLEPDVVVSVAAPEIFRAQLLETPRLGCLNIHSGRLPRYRGMMPVFWQMLSGEPSATVTVHRMVSRLDAGPVLGTVIEPILPRDSLDRMMLATKRSGARLMIRVLGDLRAGRTEGEEVRPDEGSYFSFPGPQEVAGLRRLGHRMI